MSLDREIGLQKVWGWYNAWIWGGKCAVFTACYSRICHIGGWFGFLPYPCWCWVPLHKNSWRTIKKTIFCFFTIMQFYWVIINMPEKDLRICKNCQKMDSVKWYTSHCIIRVLVVLFIYGVSELLQMKRLRNIGAD